MSERCPNCGQPDGEHHRSVFGDTYCVPPGEDWQARALAAEERISDLGRRLDAAEDMAGLNGSLASTRTQERDAAIGRLVAAEDRAKQAEQERDREREAFDRVTAGNIDLNLDIERLTAERATVMAERDAAIARAERAEDDCAVWRETHDACGREVDLGPLQAERDALKAELASYVDSQGPSPKWLRDENARLEAELAKMTDRALQGDCGAESGEPCKLKPPRVPCGCCEMARLESELAQAHAACAAMRELLDEHGVCPQCEGDGKVMDAERTVNGPCYVDMECAECGGMGKLTVPADAGRRLLELHEARGRVVLPGQRLLDVLRLERIDQLLNVEPIMHDLERALAAVDALERKP